MREKFNHLYLDSHERKLLIHSLVSLPISTVIPLILFPAIGSSSLQNGYRKSTVQINLERCSDSYRIVAQSSISLYFVLLQWSLHLY